jgi:hypothetical protein
MNTQSRLFQRIGGLGIVYSVLFIIGGLFLAGNEPSSSASGATVVKFYHSHRAGETAAVFVVAVAAVVFIFFLSSLRRTLGATTEGGHLASIVTAGGAVYVAGLLLMSALTIALVDAARHGMTAAAQTLNVLSADDWVPVVAGLSMVTLGTGVAALRGGTLPRWLAWATIGLGILALAGPLGGVAFLITPLWTLVMGIFLLRSSYGQHPVTAPSPAVAALPTS